MVPETTVRATVEKQTNLLTGPSGKNNINNPIKMGKTASPTDTNRNVEASFNSVKIIITGKSKDRRIKLIDISTHAKIFFFILFIQEIERNLVNK